MARSYSFTTLLLTLLFCFFTAENFAQSFDRVRLEKEIELLRSQLKAKEEQLLAPTAEDRAAFVNLLEADGAGLIRLLPREKYDGKLLVQGGGAYYSFTRLTHEYGYGSDLGLEQNQFRVGFAGADFGSLVNLGDVPLEAVTLDQTDVNFLATLTVPSAEPDASRGQRRSGAGIQTENSLYKASLPVVVNSTYVLRSVNYGRADVLVAFRVVRQDGDRGVLLAWKMLKEFRVPQLTRRN